MEPLYNPSIMEEMYDPSFTAEITSKMQVPKRIRVAGDGQGEVPANGSFPTSFQEYKYAMRVPDRILVVGQEQHVGTKAPPHELVVESKILPVSDNSAFRAQTPPRTITLEHLEGTDEDTSSDNEELLVVDEETSLVGVVNTKSRDTKAAPSAVGAIVAEPPPLALSSSQLTEELLLLRQHVGRLNRRVAGLERDQYKLQQWGSLSISAGAVYLVWKIILWLTRSQ